MRGVGAILVILLFSSLIARTAETPMEKKPTLSVETEISQFVPATKGYVLFLLEESAPTMSEAKAKSDERLRLFTESVQKDFPDAVPELVSVNIGTKDFGSYRASETPVIPTVSKVLIFTIPPNEALAVRLLDAGSKAGLTPFCASSQDGAFGAVYYGIPSPEEAETGLYTLGARKLRSEAEKLAKLMDCRVLKMCDISRFTPRDHAYELRFREIRITLPAEFCGSDPNKVKISLILRGNFEISAAK